MDYDYANCYVTGHLFAAWNSMAPCANVLPSATGTLRFRTDRTGWLEAILLYGDPAVWEPVSVALVDDRALTHIAFTQRCETPLRNGVRQPPTVRCALRSAHAGETVDDAAWWGAPSVVCPSADALLHPRVLHPGVDICVDVVNRSAAPVSICAGVMCMQLTPQPR